MSTQQQIFDLIKTLTEERASIAIPVLFIRMFGLHTAFLLAQLLTWPPKLETDDQWAQSSGLSTRAVLRARHDLQDRGILEIKRVKDSYAWSLNQEAIATAITEYMEGVRK